MAVTAHARSPSKTVIDVDRLEWEAPISFQSPAFIHIFISKGRLIM